MKVMSVRKSIAAYTTAAIVIAVVLIGVSTAVIPSPLTSGQTSSSTNGLNVQRTTFPILLTDPPIVPEGTTALNLSYNRVQIGLLSQNQHQWVNISASGTVDLLSLVNVSKTIALAQIPLGATVEQIKFRISAVEIDVKGATYNVTTVSNVLTVPISGGVNVQKLNVLLLDLTSHIIEIDTGNVSAPIFVLVPNAVAVVRPSSNANGNQDKIGNVSNLTPDDMHELDGAAGSASLLAKLSVSGQATSFNVAIENTGNVSLSLQAIRLEGHFNSTASQVIQCVSSESSASSSSRSQEGVAPSGFTSLDESATTSTTLSSTTESLTSSTTSSIDTSTTTTSTESSETGGQSTATSTSLATSSSSTETGDQTSSASTSLTSTSTNEASTDTSSIECGHASVFETTSELVYVPNGTTLVPFSGEVSVNNNALIIAPNTTVTLTFSGTVTSPSESEGGQILTIFPINGSVYMISAELSNGVSAVANITAT